MQLKKLDRMSRSPIRCGCYVQIIFLLFTVTSVGSEIPAEPVFEACQLTVEGGASSIQAECSQIRVPEDPEHPEGQQIQLKIVKIPAKHRNIAPDPVFLFAGGPGQAISEAYPSIAKSFSKIREDRELILVDQRGTGGSNPLECPISDDIPLSEIESIEYVNNCLEKLDANLSFYTTEYYLRDLEYVRAILGYEQINIYGASYGTRVAQEYLRRYPQRIRTMILDSVAETGYRLFYDFRITIPRAIEKMLSRCEEDPLCNSTFPELRNELDLVLGRLDSEPVTVTLSHPHTGKPLEITLTRDMFLKCLLPHLYTPETIALLPLTIHMAYEYDDFLPLAGQASSFDMGIYTGLMMAVICAEDIPFIPPESEWAPVGQFDYSSSVRMMQTICSDVNIGDTHVPVIPEVSDVPVLLLSGDSDPVTPPHRAELAMKYLTNSKHIIVPDMYHGIITRGCIDEIAAMFIQTASIDGLDTTCTQKILPFPFFINPNGPSP